MEDNDGTVRPDFTKPMNAHKSGSGRIVRWEILKGLPGEGLIPKYFHMGHPTPWAEGFVVQFWNEDGTEWVGNFQGGWGVEAVFELPDSTFLYVIAKGACYLLSKSDPSRYTFHGCGVRSALVDDAQTVLILAYSGGSLVAHGRDG